MASGAGGQNTLAPGSTGPGNSTVPGTGGTTPPGSSSAYGSPTNGTNTAANGTASGGSC